MFPRAVAAAYRITSDRPAAEDAALEALAKAHYRWSRIGSETWRDLWVLRVAINEAIRRLPRSGEAIRDKGSEDLAEEVVLRQTLVAALAKLPRRQCEVIAMRYLLGFSETEVAAALNISHGTVKTHLRRGMSGLRGTVGLALKEEHLARLT